MRLRFRLLLAGVVVLAILAWWRWPALDPDAAYSPEVRPLWPDGGPAVLVDNAHWNGASGARGLVAFTALLRADGYRVLRDGNAARAEMLADARVAVIADPMGIPGVGRRLTLALGLPPLTALASDLRA